MDVTGDPSAGSGHRSAIPVAVATLWDIRRGTRQLGTAPVTVLPTPTIRTRLPLGKGSGDVTCPSGRGARRARTESPGPPSVHARTPARGSGGTAHPATATTGACRTLIRGAHRMPPRRIWKTMHQRRPRRLQRLVGRPAQSSQDQGRYPGRLRRAPPSHSVLPTVSDHCAPRFGGK